MWAGCLEAVALFLRYCWIFLPGLSECYKSMGLGVKSGSSSVLTHQWTNTPTSSQFDLVHWPKNKVPLFSCCLSVVGRMAASTLVLLSAFQLQEEEIGQRGALFLYVEVVYMISIFIPWTSVWMPHPMISRKSKHSPNSWHLFMYHWDVPVKRKKENIYYSFGPQRQHLTQNLVWRILNLW